MAVRKSERSDRRETAAAVGHATCSTAIQQWRSLALDQRHRFRAVVAEFRIPESVYVPNGDFTQGKAKRDAVTKERTVA
jgi:hypothetical protein